jgi:hypothetical protein
LSFFQNPVGANLRFDGTASIIHPGENFEKIEQALSYVWGAKVDQNTPVFLTPGAVIIIYSLNSGAGVLASITGANLTNRTKLLHSSPAADIDPRKGRFPADGASGKITLEAQENARRWQKKYDDL